MEKERSLGGDLGMFDDDLVIAKFVGRYFLLCTTWHLTLDVTSSPLSTNDVRRTTLSKHLDL